MNWSTRIPRTAVVLVLSCVLLTGCILQPDKPPTEVDRSLKLNVPRAEVYHVVREPTDRQNLFTLREVVITISDANALTAQDGRWLGVEPIILPADTMELRITQTGIVEAKGMRGGWQTVGQLYLFFPGPGTSPNLPFASPAEMRQKGLMAPPGTRDLPMLEERKFRLIFDTDDEAWIFLEH